MTYTRIAAATASAMRFGTIIRIPPIRSAAGMRWMVEPLSMAAIAAGADGLMIEVHNNPEKALCDGKQSLTPESFDNLMGKIKKTVEFFGKTLG